MRTNDEPVIVEQTYHASIDEVWSSITEIGQMRQWYFENIPSFEPEVGFETQFNVHNQGRDFLHLWKVTEVIPLKKIKYSWRFEGYPGDSFVVFELFEQNNGTKLRLSTEITEDFPDDIPEFTRESCLGGWTFFIKDRLREFFEKIASSS